MGQDCCAIDKDQRMVDYNANKISNFQPSTSTTTSIKFPNAKIPKKNSTVDMINKQSGNFIAKKLFDQSTGTSQSPKQLNTAGLIYSGQWDNGMPNGKGQLFYPDGSYYIGYLTKGKADGQGRFISPDGWYYQGQLQNEQAEGRGVLYHKDIGYRYDGEWSGDIPNGYGSEEWLHKGVMYEGEFLNGCKHGEGTYKNTQFTYKGTLNNDKFDSFGLLEFANGDKYEGNFQNGYKHGKGVYTWKDGSYYEGYYRYDLKHGQGRYKSIDSTYWEGEWFQGKREGQGKLLKRGKTLQGSWTNGGPSNMMNSSKNEIKKIDQISFHDSKFK